jgi:SAM-dependent methyltransferase
MEKNFAAQYSDLEEWHWWFLGRRKILESVLHQELAASESRAIISVGCGPIEGLKWLVPFAGKHGKVVGLDVHSAHGQHPPAQIDFVLGALEDVPLSDASFDLVLALDVLEHLDNDAASLGKMVSLIKPGGLLLVTVPALPSLWGGQDVVSKHRRRYTKGSLGRLFDGLSLPGYQIKYFNSLLFPLAAPIRWSRRVIGLADRPRSDFDANRPGLINDMLAWAFGAESRFINHTSMPIGLSLMATYRAPMM